MTAATSTPQAMRDRLLLAIDAQSNVRNMAVVFEVLSVLEKYPITRDALEETRLGKIINDVRRKTKNEDLAKRAKKLLRNWQKFIEPGKSELLTRGFVGASWSSDGDNRPCICPPAAIASLGKTGPELKTRCDFNNCSPSVEKLSIGERKGDQKEGQPQQAKILPSTFDDQIQNSKLLHNRGVSACTTIVTNVHTHYPLDRETSQPTDKNKVNKIPIHAAKLNPSAPECKHPNVSSLAKASVLQQGQAATGGQDRPRNQQSSHTGILKQETGVKPADAQTHPSLRAGIVGTQMDHSTTSSCCENVSLEKDGSTGIMKKPKRQKSRPKDYVEPLDRPIVEDRAKTERLKERKITFDHVTGKIKPSCHKEPFWDGNISGHHRHKIQNQSAPLSLFQQTDWEELSKSKMIHSYLSQQSNVLALSGVHAHGAHIFMTSEILEKEEHWFKDGKKTHNLSDHPPKELPGVSREIRSEDLERLHMQQWSGVNGCCDSKGNWYDWTKCMPIERDGNESRLNILPYVCLDYI